MHPDELRAPHGTAFVMIFAVIIGVLIGAWLF
jgi:hypothetical protein